MPIPTIWTDYEIQEGYLVCGDRKYRMKNDLGEVDLELNSIENELRYTYSKAIALGFNRDEMIVSLINFADVASIKITINLEVTCPDLNTFAGVTFNNTLTEVPQIYYDMNTNEAMIVPMNQWAVLPTDEDDAITCF